jgi:hypothetical protein
VTAWVPCTGWAASNWTPPLSPPMFNYLNYLFCCSDRLGALHRVGRFSLDPATVPTYELHLTLTEDRTIKVRVRGEILKGNMKRMRMKKERLVCVKKGRSVGRGVEEKDGRA